MENGNVRFKRYTQFHVPFHYEEDFYKYSRNLCQNYIVIIVLVTMLIIRILAPKMEKWGQDPNNEQCTLPPKSLHIPISVYVVKHASYSELWDCGRAKGRFDILVRSGCF